MSSKDDKKGGLAVHALIVIAVPTIAVISAIWLKNILLLDYFHVLLGAIWTGVDVFFGLIFRFVYKEISPDTRKIVAQRILPATLFFLPTASILTPIAGYDLAKIEGIWSIRNTIVEAVVVLAAAVVISGFVTVFLQSLFIVTRRDKENDALLQRRFSWIVNGALIQAVLQIALISLMAYWVVFF